MEKWGVDCYGPSEGRLGDDSAERKTPARITVAFTLLLRPKPDLQFLLISSVTGISIMGNRHVLTVPTLSQEVSSGLLSTGCHQSVSVKSLKCSLNCSSASS